jgi:hypothetical protein
MNVPCPAFHEIGPNFVILIGAAQEIAGFQELGPT